MKWSFLIDNNKERSIFLIDFQLWLRTTIPKTMFEICHNYCNYSSHIYLFIWCLLFCWKYKKNIYEMKMKTKTRAKIHLYRYNMAIDRLSVCQCVMWVLFLALSLVEFSLLLLFFFYFMSFSIPSRHTHTIFDSHFIFAHFQ